MEKTEKNCEYYMEKFLELDKNQRIPGELTRHFMKCEKCRNEVKALSKAEKLAAKPLKVPVPLEADTISSVVCQIDPSFDPKKIKVPFFQWIISGVILIAALIFFAVITSSIVQFFDFFFYLFFAIAIIAYCICFIASNLDFFIKKIDVTKQS